MDSIDSLTYRVQAAVWVFTTISTVLGSIRAVLHTLISKEDTTWDDTIINISVVLNLVRAAFYQKALTSIRHIRQDYQNDTVSAATFWLWLTADWAFISLTLPKFGLGILLVRMFNARLWLRNTIMVCCNLLAVMAIIGFFGLLFVCTPTAAFWNPWRYPDAHCRSEEAWRVFAICFSTLSAAIDLIFAAYPGLIIWRLKISVQKKIGSMAFMSLGTIAFVFAVVRCVCITRLPHENPNLKLDDELVYVTLWSSLENDFILAAACLPSLPPFYRACKEGIQNYLTPPRLDEQELEEANESMAAGTNSSSTAQSDSMISFTEMLRNG